MPSVSLYSLLYIWHNKYSYRLSLNLIGRLLFVFLRNYFIVTIQTVDCSLTSKIVQGDSLYQL